MGYSLVGETTNHIGQYLLGSGLVAQIETTTVMTYCLKIVMVPYTYRNRLIPLLCKSA